MLLLIFWRSWYVRNELVHHKPAPPMNVSVRFLRSYLESLMAIKNDNGADPVKGKAYITMDTGKSRQYKCPSRLDGLNRARDGLN